MIRSRGSDAARVAQCARRIVAMANRIYNRSRKRGRMKIRRGMLAAAAGSLLLIPVFAVGPTFIPDVTFKGSALKGWRTLGDAEWRAENGEIIGKPKSAGGGWLLTDQALQDAGFYASFKSEGGAKPGIMMRLQKTGDGYKGQFVSLAEGDQYLYRMTLDAAGRETHRDRLRPAASMIRFGQPPSTAAPGGAGRGMGRGPVYKPGDWNTAQVIIDADIIRASLNSGFAPGAGVTEDQSDGFG